MTKKNKSSSAEPTSVGSSFRDPAGFLFTDAKGRLHRQINAVGAEDFDLFVQSGLYNALVKDSLLVTHEIAPNRLSPSAHAIITPDIVPFISYPFEWSFTQLKDAALLTIRIQKIALEHGMSLKDASAYNVQFMNGKPIFIDTLSFEKYKAGKPWSAYGQFCQHFLAPLALMSRVDPNLLQLLRVHLDGIPLETAAKLLPSHARLSAGLMMHLFLHAKAKQSKASEHSSKTAQKEISLVSLQAIIGSLERTVASVKPPKVSTEWADYYANNNNYSQAAADEKGKMVRRFAKTVAAKKAIDFGGNDGRYSRVLADLGMRTICSDIDPNAVEANYHQVKYYAETHMLPLLVDLTNPGGAMGWANDERTPIHLRLKTDLAMALALIHHLAISNNVPLERVARYFKEFAPFLIIEFVPKEDSQVQKLLATREDIFPDYHRDGFVAAFETHYRLVKESKIKGTKRSLYLFERR